MSWVPKFNLYDTSDVLVMQLPNVFYTNAPQTPLKYTVVEGIRGNGGIVVQGSKSTWDLVIKGRLLAEDFQALEALIDTLESNVAEGVQFTLKFDKTPITYYSYKVTRLVPIEYPESIRTNYTEYQITFKVSTW